MEKCFFLNLTCFLIKRFKFELLNANRPSNQCCGLNGRVRILVSEVQREKQNKRQRR